jgi:hypothetical protein
MRETLEILLRDWVDGRIAIFEGIAVSVDKKREKSVAG